MRQADGSWMQPPPPWPAITGQGLTLAETLDQAKTGLDLETLAARLR
jgi:predicted RNase H-like HicB family nuclease